MIDRTTQRLIAIGATGAPLLHSITDVMEWLQGGFSTFQLWLNYLAFLPLPAIMIGLYAVQRPKISRVGLPGAILYGFAFIYFTFTTLTALSTRVATYAGLWNELGYTYTAHGALMIVGGALFGIASVRSRVLTFVETDAIYQTLGTGLRNAGLIGMGWATWKKAA